jgi:hypothetical protein
LHKLTPYSYNRFIYIHFTTKEEKEKGALCSHYSWYIAIFLIAALELLPSITNMNCPLKELKVASNLLFVILPLYKME